MSLQLVSLFAGVGGFDIAAERSGIDPIVACEIDPQARGVLQHRFPNTILINDVKDVTGERLTELGLDPRRTVITGGFPCQDLSIAGKQAGLEGGERSSLFFEIVRILREFNPQWFILENVPGLLSSKRGRDMGVVVGSLAELGYSFSWRILDAQNFGVPQRRRRVFIVGHLGTDATRAEQVLFESEGSRGDIEASQPQGQDTAGDPAPSTDSNSFRMLGFGDYEPDDTASALKARDYKDATDLIVPPVRVLDGTRVGDVRVTEGQTMQTVISRWGTGGNNVPMIETDLIAIPIADQATRFNGNRNGKKDGKGNGFGIGEQGDPMNTLTSGDKHAVSITERVTTVRRPMIETIGFSHTQGIDAQPSTTAFPTLRREGNGHAVAYSIREEAKPTTTVRRLTPMECERLQGFPDGWSAQRIDHKKGIVVDQADSSRYKQMGNAVAVPVVEWILNRLVLTEETK